MLDLTGLLPKVLSEQQIARMHEAALAVIENVGLAVSRQDVRDGVAGQPGVTVQGERVRIATWRSGELVEAWRQSSLAATRSQPVEGQGFVVPTIGHAMNILDPETGEMREITAADLVQAATLAHALGERGIVGGAPGFPMDVPPLLRQISQFKISLENSRFRGHPGPDDARIAQIVREMCLVVGAPFGTGLHMISPLRLEGNEFDIVMHFAQEKLPVGVGTMPTAGVTAPVHLPALFVQSMAEVMGGFVVLKLLGFEDVSFWVNAYPADMRTLNLVFGSPEHILCDLMQLAINAYYGVSAGAKGFITMAKAPDMQAAADAAAHTAVLALAGAREVSGAGALSLDEAYSSEKLIIDCEIADYIRRLIRGFTFDDAMLSWEAIAEGVEAGGFMGLSGTVQSYRQVYWLPKLFTHELLGQWRAEGAQSLQERARAAIADAMARYNYQLPAEQQRELDRIYRWAEERLSA